jgi:hypothetical protein
VFKTVALTDKEPEESNVTPPLTVCVPLGTTVTVPVTRLKLGVFSNVTAPDTCNFPVLSLAMVTLKAVASVPPETVTVAPAILSKSNFGVFKTEIPPVTKPGVAVFKRETEPPVKVLTLTFR